MNLKKEVNKEENLQELGRKILHIMIGTAALLLLIHNIITPFIIFIFLIIFTLFSLFSLRYKIPIAYFFLNKFEVKGRNQLPGRGFLFAIAGTLLALQLFERDIALASIIILIFADPLSYLFGKYIGKTRSFIDKRKNILQVLLLVLYLLCFLSIQF